MKVVLAVCLAALLCTVQGAPEFTAKIVMEREYEMGSAVTCSVSITNNDNQDYYLLKHNTPLEGLKSSLFSISYDGKKVLYDGLLFKRGPPSKTDYIHVPGRSTLMNILDLTQAYAMKNAGAYDVRLEVMLQFFKDGETNSTRQHVDVSSNIVTFTLTDNKNQPPKLTKAEALRVNATKTFLSSSKLKSPRSPLFRGTGSSNDKSTATTAWNAAYNVLPKAYRSVYSNPTLYKKWFGDSYYADSVEGTYLDIRSAMESTTFSLYFHGPNCGDGVVAYTYHGATTLYFCDGYFSARTTGTDSKMGTIVHEMSHAVAYTEDIKYGQRDCQLLAIRSPRKAILNADNYEYFAEAQ